VSAKTDAGRIMVTAFIISALVAVPREIQKFFGLGDRSTCKGRRNQDASPRKEIGNSSNSNNNSNCWRDIFLICYGCIGRTGCPLFPTIPSTGTASVTVSGGVAMTTSSAAVAPSSPTIARYRCAGVALQLASSCAAQLHLLPRLRAALQLDSLPTAADIVPAVSDDKGDSVAPASSASLAAASSLANPLSLEQQCAQIASLLFGTVLPVAPVGRKEWQTRSPSPSSSSVNSR